MTTTKNYPDNITALYARLSQEDALDRESNSIANQKKILLKYAKDNGFPNPTFFIDDGVSGVTFDRPGWNEMIRLSEAGKVKTVIVKDMSRMGCNYLKVGYYTESFFAERDIRYIAINDGVDSDKGDNEFTPFRNLFNDFYARDTSKKIRAVMRSKGNAGEHLCTNPPYGYRKDPDDKKKWIVDEEAAAVVKKIFDLCIAGKGPKQIAKALTADKVLTVKAYYAKRDGKAMPDNLYRWDYKSIAGILERPEYTGCTVNFKTYSKSHKLKKRLQNAPENYRIFPNTQPAIIEEQVFERVQELRANKRRPTKTGRQGLFSGLLYCADCGEKLYFCTTNSFTPKQEHYVCSNYKSNTGTCSAHFIREETLKLFVLQRIFDVTAMFFDDIQRFQNMVYQQRFEEAEKAVKRQKKELEQARKRITELDRIFKRIYEDDINGTISHERFLKLSAEYEAEQKELTEFVKTEQAAVDTYEQDKTDFDSFAAVIRKYVGIRELTPAIVNEFVKKIIVHAPDKSSGHRRQKIEIVWNFIGELEQGEDEQTIERQRKSRTA
nr:recombinase family protein [uncultured Anaerostipes sp.]